MVHFVSRYTRGVQVKLRDILRTRDIYLSAYDKALYKSKFKFILPYLTLLRPNFNRGSKSANFGYRSTTFIWESLSVASKAFLK